MGQCADYTKCDVTVKIVVEALGVTKICIMIRFYIEEYGTKKQNYAKHCLNETIYSIPHLGIIH